MDETEVFTFRWTLENFTQCLQLSTQPVYSPVFAADVPKQSYWRLKLYPRRKYNDPCVSCYLEYHKSNKCHRLKVDFQLSIIDADDRDIISRFFEGKVFRPDRRFGAKQFADNMILMSNAAEMLPGGHLTIQCSMTTFLVTNDDGDLHRLSRVFLGLFWTSVFSDLVLKTKPEQKFRVHRELIRARARKFYRVHGLNNKSVVKIPGTPPDVLQAFLMYLYSGMIKSTDPDVWDRLYQMSERYGVFYLRRDIVPTPTEITVSTRMVYSTKTIVFPVRNFRDVSRISMGRLVDLGFARVGVEYFVNDVFADHLVCIGIKSYLSNPDSIGESFVCSVSVLDVPDKQPYFTSHHEVVCDKSATVVTLRTYILTRYLLRDKFLLKGTLLFRIAFSVLISEEPVKIRSSKRRESLCIGLNTPTIPTLLSLSMDLGKLVESSPLPTLNYNIMLEDFSSIQKAVFSAWSWVFQDLFRPQNEANPVNRRPINLEAFKLLYRYVCTGNIPFPVAEAAYNLYPVATEYQLPSLRELIVKKVKSQLVHSNAVVSLMFADIYNVEELLAFVKNFIRQNYSLVSREESWRDLRLGYPALVETVLGNVNDEFIMNVD